MLVFFNSALTLTTVCKHNYVVLTDSSRGFSQNFYEIFAKFLQKFYEIFAKFLRNFCEIRKNFVKFLQKTTYRVRYVVFCESFTKFL